MAVLAAERGVVARHLVGRSAVTSFRCECHPGGESFLILCRLGKWELFDFEESFFLFFLILEIITDQCSRPRFLVQAMRNFFAWRTNADASRVEISFGFAGHEKMTMETLPALWKRPQLESKPDAADAISVSSESVAPVTPLDKDTCSAEHVAMPKEQQVLAHLTSETLERLHASVAAAIEVDRGTVFIQLLEAASLDVLDDRLARRDLEAIRDVVQKAHAFLVACKQ